MECFLCGNECENVSHVHCGSVQHIAILELGFFEEASRVVIRSTRTLYH